MTIPARLRVLCSLSVLSVLLLAAAPPKEGETSPAKKAEPQTDKNDPTKPRYVKCDDAKIIKYAETWYLSDGALARIGDSCQGCKLDEQAPRMELEMYKQTPNPDKDVIRYLAGKVAKAEKKTKEWEAAHARMKEDFAEYKKTKRIPTWIIEEYNRLKAQEEYRKARDQRAKKLLPAAAPPEEAAPAKKTEPRADKNPGTKSRYVKTEDRKIIEYAEYWYFNDSALLQQEETCKSLKQVEQVPRDELEAYKQTPNREKAVIRYLEGKVQKAEKYTKAWEEAYARNKEDFAEYKKTKRIPTWIIEEYNRLKAQEEFRKARDPEEAKKPPRS